jgi:hypothetical protein
VLDDGSWYAGHFLAIAVVISFVVAAVIFYFVGNWQGHDEERAAHVAVQIPQPAQPPQATTPVPPLPTEKKQTVEACGQGPTEKPLQCVVQKGDTAWALADYYCGDPLYWPTIAAANPRFIHAPLFWLYAGTTILIPTACDASKFPRPKYPQVGKPKETPKKEAPSADPQKPPQATKAYGEEEVGATTQAMLVSNEEPDIELVAAMADLPVQTFSVSIGEPKAPEVPKPQKKSESLQGVYRVPLASNENLPEGRFPAYFKDNCQTYRDGHEVCTVRRKVVVDVTKDDHGFYLLTVPIKESVQSSGVLAIDFAKGDGQIGGVTGAQLLSDGSRIPDAPPVTTKLQKKEYASLSAIIQTPPGWKARIFGILLRAGIGFSRGNIPGAAIAIGIPTFTDALNYHSSQQNLRRLQLIAQKQAQAQ